MSGSGCRLPPRAYPALRGSMNQSPAERIGKPSYLDAQGRTRGPFAGSNPGADCPDQGQKSLSAFAPGGALSARRAASNRLAGIAGKPPGVAVESAELVGEEVVGLACLSFGNESNAYGPRLVPSRPATGARSRRTLAWALFFCRGPVLSTL